MPNTSNDRPRRTYSTTDGKNTALGYLGVYGFATSASDAAVKITARRHSPTTARVPHQRSG
jgi:hypothetical protein